ncbi:hypothetical protein Tco_0250463 [Tanacetum coccineum]
MKAIRDQVKEGKIPFKANKDILNEVLHSTDRGHRAGVGRLLPGTSSSSSSSQPGPRYCIQEEADRLRKEAEEQIKAFESRAPAFINFVNSSQIVRLDGDGTGDGDSNGGLDGDSNDTGDE